jgi:integrase
VSATGATGADFTLYDARHTFSSRLLAAGIPLVEIAVWMSHSLRAGGEQLNATPRTCAYATGEFSLAAIP